MDSTASPEAAETPPARAVPWKPLIMVGLIGAIEIVKDKATLERFDEKQGVGTICRDLLIDNGLVLRAVGDTIVCAPPFVLSHDEADELVEIAWKCLDLTQQAVQ